MAGSRGSAESVEKLFEQFETETDSKDNTSKSLTKPIKVDQQNAPINISSDLIKLK